MLNLSRDSSCYIKSWFNDSYLKFRYNVLQIPSGNLLLPDENNRFLHQVLLLSSSANFTFSSLPNPRPTPITTSASFKLTVEASFAFLSTTSTPDAETSTVLTSPASWCSSFLIFKSSWCNSNNYSLFCF